MQADEIHPLVGIGRELNLQFVLGYDPLEFAGALTAIADGTRRPVAVDHRPGRRRRRPAGLHRPRRPRAPRQDPGDARLNGPIQKPRRAATSASSDVDRDADLLGRVAVADRHRVVVERVEVDGDAQRRADLVLAAVARPIDWVSS